MGFVSLNPPYANDDRPSHHVRFVRELVWRVAHGRYHLGCQVMSAKMAITPANAGQPSANQMRNRSRY